MMNNKLIEAMGAFIDTLLTDDVDFITEAKYNDSVKYKKKLSSKQKKYQALTKKIIKDKFGPDKRMQDLTDSEKAKVYRALEYNWQTDDEKKGKYGDTKKESLVFDENMSNEEKYANELMLESCELLEDVSYRSRFKGALMKQNVSDPSDLLLHERIMFYVNIK